jgi:replicative DNA helicase
MNSGGLDDVKLAFARDPMPMVAALGLRVDERKSKLPQAVWCYDGNETEASLLIGGKLQGLWKRFGADEKAGDVFDLVRSVRGCDFQVATEFAASVYGIERGTAPPRRGGKAPRETRWRAVEADGRVVAEHVRLDYDDGRKRLWWERDGRKDLGTLSTTMLPLYNLPCLTACAAECSVIITEGEKACDAVAGAGYVGLGTWGAEVIPIPEQLQPLVGHAVYLWPDNDAPGRRHMRKLAAALQELGCHPLLINWSDAPEKGDAADFTGDIGELLEQAELIPDADEEPDEVSPALADQERLVIGAMLADGALRGWCLANVRATDFSVPGHRAIHETIGLLQTEAGVVDPTLVAARLEARFPDLSPGMLRLYAEMTPDRATLRHHAAALREAALGREVARLGKRLSSSRDGRQALEIAQVELRGIMGNMQGTRTAEPVWDRAVADIERSELLRSQPHEITGARFGIEEIDHPLRGIADQQLVLLKGQSGFGKTTLALQAVFETGSAYIGRDDVVGLVYLLEDTQFSVFRRFLQWDGYLPEAFVGDGGANITWGSGEDGMCDRLATAYSRWPLLPLRMTDQIHQLGDLEIDIRNHAMDKQVLFVLVDYAQRVRGGEGDNFTQRLEDCANRIANLAGEIGAPIIVPSQVTIQQDKRHTEKHATGWRDAASLAVEIERGKPGDALHEKQLSNEVLVYCDKSRNKKPFKPALCRAQFEYRRIHGPRAWERLQSAEQMGPSDRGQDPWAA